MGVDKRFQIDWNDERVALLRTRWNEGHSASVIANEIGCGVSRSAVLGKVDRLKLSKRKNRSPSDEPRKSRQPIVRKNYSKRGYSAWSTVPEVEPEPFVIDDTADADIPLSRRRTLLQLNSETCRWPVGDPGTPDFFFCGAEPLRGHPYCAGHCLRAYNVRQRISDAERERRSYLGKMMTARNNAKRMA